jgi:endonuclease G
MDNKIKVGIIVVILAAAARFFGVDQALIGELTGEIGQQGQTERGEDSNGGGLLENFLPTTSIGDTLNYPPYFTVSYSKNHRQSEWVAYELTAENLAKEDFRRPPSFKPDDRIEKKYRVKHTDYSGLGFDRGHLASAADFNWSRAGIETTFFTTNISPQVPRFNRGIWKKLESSVRGWAVQYGQLYVVTGPILTERAKERFPRDRNYIAVPRRYYKIILNYNDDTPIAAAFIMNNEDMSAALSNYIVTIDEVEKATGIDFFSELPDALEAELESSINLDDFGLNAMSRSIAIMQYDTSAVQ